MTIDVVVESASGGVGSFDLGVGVNSSSVEIVSADVYGEPNRSIVDASSGSADLAAYGMEEDDSTIATVTLRGVEPGRAELVFFRVVVGDRNASEYEDVVVANRTVEVVGTETDSGGDGGDGGAGASSADDDDDEEPTETGTSTERGTSTESGTATETGTSTAETGTSTETPARQPTADEPTETVTTTTEDTPEAGAVVEAPGALSWPESLVMLVLVAGLLGGGYLAINRYLDGD